MRADEALNKSMDGVIYLRGKAAQQSSACSLSWVVKNERNSSYGQIGFKDLFSDQWEPEKPRLKCKACLEIDIRIANPLYMSKIDPMIQHLKDFHCTCEGAKWHS